MSNNYGKKYPGSGGATDRPQHGGADWHPLPAGTFARVPVTKTVVEEHKPCFIGRILGRETTYTKREVVVRHEVRKQYR